MEALHSRLLQRRRESDGREYGARILYIEQRFSPLLVRIQGLQPPALSRTNS
jgi:hypothetical protein